MRGLPRLCTALLLVLAASQVRAADVERLIESLTPEQKVGQLLAVGIEGKRMAAAQERLLKQLEPGGVAIFGRNVSNPRQVARLLAALDRIVGRVVPPFLATDQEGGAVVRLKKGALVFPGAMLLGAAGDPGLARKVGTATGRDLSRLGFNVNLAPVMDVNSRADNPVIGIRSFSEDPDVVGILGTAFARGLAEGGVLPVAKHFPGHGDTSVDSHGALPSLPHGLDRLLKVELKPFKKAIDEGACPIIMTAHVALPALERTGEVIPSTVSKTVVTGLLRHRLGFDGIVLTDDLGMAALSGMSVGEAAVKAIGAGADMLLISRGAKAQLAVKRAVLKALETGRLSWSRIHKSLNRIISLKGRFGILDRSRKVDFNPEPSMEGKELVVEVAKRGVTLVWNRDAVLPVKDREKVLILSQSSTFLKDLRRLVPDLVGWSISSRISEASAAKLVDEALKGLDPAKVVVAITNKRGLKVLKRMNAKTRAKVAVVALGSPYLLAKVGWAQAAVAAYSFRWPACWAAARLVAGKLNPTGRLPVTIPGVARRGAGLALHMEARSGAPGVR